MTSWKTIPADRYDVAVVGGGAAGMTAAIAAARTGARVALLERGDRPGRKLLMTGNGKCNLGNRDLKPSYYYSDNMAMAASVLERFGTEETIAFFASLGLMIRERRGYLYPASEQAAVVLDVLRYGLEREGVTVLTQAMVRELVPLAGVAASQPSRNPPGVSRQSAQRKASPKYTPPHASCVTEEITGRPHKGQRAAGDVLTRGYILWLEDGCQLWAGRVVLACGGQAAPRTGSDGSGYGLARSLGHQVISPVPSLVQLHCSEKYCKALAGVRAEGKVRIYWDKSQEPPCFQSGNGSGRPGKKLSGAAKNMYGDLVMEESGEIQLTEYGISGIPAFQLSGGVNQLLARGNKLRAELDFFPQYETDAYEQLCRSRMERVDRGTVEMFFTGMLHKKIMNVCIRQAGLSPEQNIAGADQQRLWQVFALCRRLPFTITGSHPFDSAQVCRGGVSMEEVDPQLQSKCSPGLYLAGELLHVDGRCGGYNLQWAWASGYIAGSAAGAEENAGFKCRLKKSGGAIITGEKSTEFSCG